MRLKRWIQRHQLLASVLIFAFITAPQWLASVWALFSSEPFVSWLMRHDVPHFRFSSWWITAPVGAVMFLIVVWIGRRRETLVTNPIKKTLRKQALQLEPDIKINLTPNRWASPALATVINANRNYPAHIEAATLFGIVQDGTNQRITGSWNHRFQDCTILPHSLEPDRRIQIAFAGHIPYDYS
jgi:hypothetical protein